MSAAALLKLSLQVSDCEAIDWDLLDSDLEDKLLEDLKAIEQLIAYHRQHRELAAASQGSVPEQWGELILLERLGSGGFGEVYRAHDPTLERDVALKLLRSDRAQNPQRRLEMVHEGKLLAKLHHPNVATVFGAAEHEGRIGLWMELIEGSNLEEIVARQGPYRAKEAAIIGADLCKALAAAHREGLIHGDVTARNVMRRAGGQIVLMDFGLGRSLDEDGGDDGQVRGTPLYLAPEILNGRPPSLPGDVYSLGVLLFFLVSGKFPLTGKSVSELRGKHAQGERRLLRDIRPDLPDWFIDPVEACLDPDPARRPQSMGTLEGMIFKGLYRADSVASKRPGSEGSPRGRRAGTPPPTPKSRWLPTAAALLLILGALSGVWLSDFISSSQPEVQWVLIADVDNRTGNPDLDDTPRELLGIAMEQGSRFRPFPRYRYRTTLQRMLQPIETPLSLDVVREIVQREGLYAAIKLEVVQDDQGFSLICSVFDKDWRRISVLRQQFDELDGIFEAVGQLTLEVIEALGDTADPSLPQTHLEQVTTTSLKALQRYSQALELYSQGEHGKAIKLLRTAVEIDSMFAMAQIRLALYLAGRGGTAEALQLSEKAYRHRRRVSEKEKYFITAEYHALRVQYQEAIENYETVVLLDPNDAVAHRQIALLRANLLEPENAIDPVREAIRIHPDSSINQGLLAVLLAESNRPLEAFQQIKQARTLLPTKERIYLYWGEGLARLVNGDADKALAAFDQLKGSSDATFRSYGEQFLARTFSYLGRFKKAMEELKTGIGLDIRESFERSAANRYVYLATLLDLQGQAESALAWIEPLERLENLPPNLKPLREAGIWLARLGELDRAEAVLARLKRLNDEYESAFSRGATAHLAGEIARVRRDQQASLYLEQAAIHWPDPLTLQSLAWYRMAQGDWQEAEETLEKLLSRKGQIFRSYLPTIWVRAHLDLAVCKEQLGSHDEALRLEQRFESLWGEERTSRLRFSASRQEK